MRQINTTYFLQQSGIEAYPQASPRYFDLQTSKYVICHHCLDSGLNVLQRHTYHHVLMFFYQLAEFLYTCWHFPKANAAGHYHISSFHAWFGSQYVFRGSMVLNSDFLPTVHVFYTHPTTFSPVATSRTLGECLPFPCYPNPWQLPQFHLMKSACLLTFRRSFLFSFSQHFHSVKTS